MIRPVLDHVVLDVHDGMREAAAQYRDLGFTLTPRGHHTLGSINHLAMFETDYLELLGWPETGGAARPELQSAPRGLNGLVFKTEDADATFARLSAAGLAAAPPRAFSRPVTLDGGTHDAKFRTVNVLGESARIGRLYFCEHLTPELVWREEWLTHANGAASIHSLAIESAVPEALAALFRVMFGESCVHAEGKRFRVDAGRPFIEIGPGGGPGRMTILRLAGSGTPRTIAMEQAGGVRLEFVGG